MGVAGELLGKWAPSPKVKVPMVFKTWLGMCGSGSTIGIAWITIATLLPPIPRDQREVYTGFFVAVHGRPEAIT